MRLVPDGEIDALAGDTGGVASGGVALRGDPPKGSGRYEPRADGYAYAADLIAGLKASRRFRGQRRLLSGGAPRGPEPPTADSTTCAKVDAGATG